MEYYAAIKKDEFLSFAETLMNLETIILSKLTQNRKPNTTCSHSPHVRMNNESTWTQGGEHHKLGPVRVGPRGGIALGEIPNVDDGVMDAANHHGTCIPM